MPAKLSVNLNAIALLRNRRDLPWPSVIELGRIALDAGASGLTVHPRPDQRHIRFSDLRPIKAMIASSFPGAELNVEGFPSEHFLQLIDEHRPQQATLVPDEPLQATSDHGWDFSLHRTLLEGAVYRLKEMGVRVSVFADPTPDAESLNIANEVGADRIELFTGPYAAHYDNPVAAALIVEALGSTADLALDLGLSVNAGHDLTEANLPALIARIPRLAEVSVGHGLIADALEHGIAASVRRFRRACGQDV
ncbi:pyridoxine 5'-phosphate synthase [Ensifer sp. MPMI2T]|nr:pyridoxine 5'-phosphate synthase [Ensifer sp. MPMI2T]